MTTAAAEAVGAVALGAGAIASHINVNISVPYVGVPLNVVVAACLGVIAGLAWSDKDQTRKEQFRIALGSVFAGCATMACAAFALSVINNVTLPPGVQASAALLIALFGPRWVPAVNERIGPWLDKLPFIGKKGA